MLAWSHLCSLHLPLLLQCSFHLEYRCFSLMLANAEAAGISSAITTTNNTELGFYLHTIHATHLPDGPLQSFLSKHMKLTVILVGKASKERGSFADVISACFPNHSSQTHYRCFPLQDNRINQYAIMERNISAGNSQLSGNSTSHI